MSYLTKHFDGAVNTFAIRNFADGSPAVQISGIGGQSLDNNITNDPGMSLGAKPLMPGGFG